MPGRHISLGDGDETRETCFGSQQIVAVGIQRALCHLITDREKLACGIQKKAELHRREDRFHGITESLQPLTEQPGRTSRAVELCHKRGRVRERIIASLGLRRELGVGARQRGDGGLAPRRQIRQRRHRVQEQPYCLIRRGGRDDIGIAGDERCPWHELGDIVSVASGGGTQGFRPSQQVRAGVVVSPLRHPSRELGGTIRIMR